MRLSHIQLENWRNFRSLTLAMQDRMFLVGPNASGKSNFLDALRFLRDLVTAGGGLEKAIQDRGGVSRVRCLAARQPSTVNFDVMLSEEPQESWRYRLVVGQDNQRRPSVREEKAWNNGKLVCDRPDQKDEEDPERRTQTYIQQVNSNKDFRPIAEFFASIRYWHVVPQLIRDPERSVGKQNDPFGGDLLDIIYQTQKPTREARLRWIQEALMIAVPQMEELHLEPDEHSTLHLKGKYKHWRPSGSWQNEKDFSDGTLRLIGLLWAFLDGSGPLLLEEPELSLHPGVVQHLPQMMARMVRMQRRRPRQIVLSTHSSELLSDPGIGADEIAMFIPGADGTVVKTGADIAEVQKLLSSGLTAAEVVLPYTRPRNADQLLALEER